MNPEDDKQGALARMFGGWNRLRSNPLADIALGFTPAGVVADVQDMARAVRDRSPTGIALAGAGFLPFGDIAKPLIRNLPNRAASEAALDPEKLSSIGSRGLSGVADLLSGRGNMGSGVFDRYKKLVESGDEDAARNLLNAARWSVVPNEAALRAREAARLRTDIMLRNEDIPILGVPEIAEIYPGAGQRYIERASRPDLSMAPEDVAARAEEMFPVRLLHGADASKISSLAERGLRPNKQFFTAVDDPVGAEIATSYAGPGGGVLPLRADPGKVFEIDAGGKGWANISLDDMIRSMYGSGMSRDEIVDFLKNRQSVQSGQLQYNFGGDPEGLEQFLYEVTDPYSTPSPGVLSELREITDYTTNDVSRAAEELGYDSALIRNVRDRSWSEPLPTDIPDLSDVPGDIMILQGERPRVRHENALFDPEMVGERDIFAGLAGLFGVGAAARMMNQNREER